MGSSGSGEGDGRRIPGRGLQCQELERGEERRGRGFGVDLREIEDYDW